MGVRRALDRWGDPALAVALAISFQYDLWAHGISGVGNAGRAVLAVAGALMTLPLAWRRRAPGEVLLVVVGAFVVVWGVAGGPGSGPVTLFLAPILAFYSAGAHCRERRSLPLAATAMALAAGAMLVTALQDNEAPRAGAWLVWAIAWLAGRDMRRRRTELRRLHERAGALEHERDETARAAVTDERGRIARELHDIVAHNVSVMVVQAQAGPRLAGSPEEVSRTFGAIESSGREALNELRRLLGILRTNDEQTAIGPQPGLGSLESLLDQVRNAGLEAEYRVEGEPTVLQPGVDLSAYRIVQEALTNTLKHADGARAEIVVRYAPGALELEIVDDGPGPPPEPNGAGHGLIGMRERVALYGGELESGAAEHGGFAVRARLPLSAGAQ